MTDPAALRMLVYGGDQRKAARPRLPVLSLLSGQPGRVLSSALPELAPPGLPRPGARRRVRHGLDAGPGCRLCNASRGAPGGAAEVWHAPEDVLCLRHRRWTAGLDDAGRQPGLADQPEILGAFRVYRRMARVHGRGPLRSLYLKADWIIREWHDSGSYAYPWNEGFGQRMSRFAGLGWEVRLGSPLAEAAKYPQVVALTRLIASPYWVNLALRDHLAAGRPDGERRDRAAALVIEYRRKAMAAGTPLPDPLTPRHLLSGIAAGFLLEDGPSLQKFLSDMRRTVEHRYEWDPFPAKVRFEEPEQRPADPLAGLLHDWAAARRASAVQGG
jgi:hypothetical protein